MIDDLCLLNFTPNMKKSMIQTTTTPVIASSTTIVIFLLVIVLVLPDASTGVLQFNCGHQLIHNTSIFFPNFVATMENVSSQMRSFGYGVAISGTGADASYGLAQCFGNLFTIDCALCYAEARTLLPQCFPYTGGRVFLDGCFVRSENYSFFQEFTGPQDVAVCGNKTTGDSLAFPESARKVVLQAAADAPRRNGSRVAVVVLRGDSGDGNVSAPVYVLAQCWRTLDENSCRECLENASASILGCLPSSEGRALSTGCFIRYSDTNFLIPTPPASPPRARLPFPMAKPGCRDTCGNNVTIPYPFGIGSDCALNESYNISCETKSTNVSQNQNDLQTPFIKVKGNEYEVLEVSLRDQTVTINAPLGNTSCYANYTSNFTNSLRFGGTYGSVNLTGTPFLYSKEHNRLTLLGCGNALLYPNQVVIGSSSSTKVLSGCTSTCLLTRSDTSSCFGINCCQTDIPFNLQQYWVNFTATETSNNSSSKCTTAILVNKEWKPENTNSLIPVVLSWTLPSPSETDAILSCSRKISILELQSANISNYGCECEKFGSLTWFYKINPYLNGACDNATSVIILSGTRKSTTKLVATISAAAGFVLMIAIFTLYKMLKKWHKKRRKVKFFKQNGGLLLQQQLSSDEGVVDITKIFSATQLKKASDGYNANRVLGEGGQATVYKGMLTDGRIVAIKKSKKVGKNQLEQFINEMVILSQVNHRHVVKLLGCCLETEVPLLVYEFIPNGTLFNLIHHHDNDQEFPLTWSNRIRIAMEVASALAYLHSSISTPVFHKDIKSSNILLDEKHAAKVSDFGISRSVAIDKTHLTTCVQGTFGYIDPEYFQSGQFTDKSDVYSFGVVLIELLTRQKPISAGQRSEDSDLGLASRFLECMGKSSLETILDPQIMDEKNDEEVLAVAKLAQRCVNLSGRKRPTMKEVAMELESIKISNLDSTIQANSPSGQRYIGEEFGHTWTFGRESIVPDESHNIPLLFDTI